MSDATNMKTATPPEDLPEDVDGQSDEDVAMEEDKVEQELPGFKAWLPTVWPISHSTASPLINQTYYQWLQTALASQADQRLHNLYDLAVSPGCDAGWRSVSMASLHHKVEMYVQDIDLYIVWWMLCGVDIGVNFRDKGVNFWDKGVNFRDKGVNFRDKGVNFWDKGVNFWDKGVNFRDKGVNFWDKGVNFWDKGVNFWDKGVNFWDKGVNFWDKGVNFWDNGVNFWNKGVIHKYFPNPLIS